MLNGLESKYYVFKAVSPSTITQKSSSGYGDITLDITDGIITITSDEEFSSNVFLDDNQNSSAEWVDASTIKFYPIDSWGTLVGEIKEYD